MLATTTQDLVLGLATLAFSFLGTVFTGVMTYLMAKLNKKQDEAAKEVKEVKATLDTTTKKADEKQDVIVEQIEVIHKATNSLSSQLAAASKAEGLAQGALDERNRNDAANKPTT